MADQWYGRKDIKNVLAPGAGFGVMFGKALGSLATPVASYTGGTAGALTPAAGNVLIPATALVPGASRINVTGLLRRVGANATAVLNVRLGKNNSTSDNPIASFTLAATNNLDVQFNINVYVTASTAFTSSGALLGAAAASSILDVTTQFDTTLDNYIKFDMSSANASDAFKLVSFNVVHFG